jgi:ArsR family transcriptional regulator
MRMPGIAAEAIAFGRFSDSAADKASDLHSTTNLLSPSFTSPDNQIDSGHNINYLGYMDDTQAIAALAALAQTTRLDTFRLLVKHEPDGLPVGELARSIDVPQNTMSAHLAILSRAGLIDGERRSRMIIYRANLDTFRDLTLFLIKDCCGGNAELCTPLIADLVP